MGQWEFIQMGIQAKLDNLAHYEVLHHFAAVGKMVDAGSDTKRVKRNRGRSSFEHVFSYLLFCNI